MEARRGSVPGLDGCGANGVKAKARIARRTGAEIWGVGWVEVEAGIGRMSGAGT